MAVSGEAGVQEAVRWGGRLEAPGDEQAQGRVRKWGRWMDRDSGAGSGGGVSREGWRWPLLSSPLHFPLPVPLLMALRSPHNKVPLMAELTAQITPRDEHCPTSQRNRVCHLGWGLQGPFLARGTRALGLSHPFPPLWIG